jgi:hypothetical protein
VSDNPVKIAKMAFLTDPASRVAVLNIQVEGEELQRFQIEKHHLFALNAKTADILLRDYK